MSGASNDARWVVATASAEVTKLRPPEASLAARAPAPSRCLPPSCLRSAGGLRGQAVQQRPKPVVINALGLEAIRIVGIAHEYVQVVALARASGGRACDRLRDKEFV